ncbi:MAG: type II secretion system protein [Minisyncoccia bacterium]
MTARNKNEHNGFTLLELLIVMAIIGVIASIMLFAINNANSKGRDSARKSQVLEILKALELHYSINGSYPLQGGAAGTGGYLSTIDATFYGAGKAIITLPDESNSRYYYCVSSNRSSMMVAVDTEDDKGGSNFCSIIRGSGDYGCIAWYTTNASDSCLTRF